MSRPDSRRTRSGCCSPRWTRSRTPRASPRGAPTTRSSRPTLRAALADALARGSRRLLATYLQTLLAYPDGCTRGEAVFDPETDDVLVQVPPLKLYPKERARVDLVAAERLQGRRVLVYATHTGTRDITGRMEDFLGRARRDRLVGPHSIEGTSPQVAVPPGPVHV